MTLLTPIKLYTPLTDEVNEKLRVGQRVLLNGVVLTARDAAHKKLNKFLELGNELPFSLQGTVIYYVAPTPAKPGQVIGSAGPTTSSRMDIYTPRLLTLGIKGTIGHGKRSHQIVRSLKKYKSVYFIAVGGTAALIAKSIKASRIIAFPELGSEAIHELIVENFPVIVANDIFGGDIYEEGWKRYALKS
ncbi:MAG: Fe-S-containing hydro-lyase [Peptococcaceae bacterium]